MSLLHWWQNLKRLQWPRICCVAEFEIGEIVAFVYMRHFPAGCWVHRDSFFLICAPSVYCDFCPHTATTWTRGLRVSGGKRHRVADFNSLKENSEGAQSMHPESHESWIYHVETFGECLSPVCGIIWDLQRSPSSLGLAQAANSSWFWAEILLGTGLMAELLNK